MFKIGLWMLFHVGIPFIFLIPFTSKCALVDCGLEEVGKQGWRLAAQESGSFTEST